MPKRLTITIPHDLGAAEVRRRIDLHMDWALRRLEAEKIQVEAEDWLGSRRAFAGRGYGQRAKVAIQVADEALQIEALVPWMAGMFAPVIEAVGRHYAERLLSDEGAS
ncbi:polyhydroxyalkanoic acid system family protein [Methylobacterium fujisawaense]|uniref:polyhydroxyalkanoic acid system family protein n=1 Tax=Methylobacterium fujisawaense TaxID=107400 RepID=UPI00313DAF86